MFILKIFGIFFIIHTSIVVYETFSIKTDMKKINEDNSFLAKIFLF